MSAPQFTPENMLGYAYAAYCAGWRAAIQASFGDPDQLTENHGYQWLRDNSPKHLDEPLWRDLPPIAKAVQQ